MVAADVLPVPDLVRVAEGHAVGLVGAVLLHEHAEARNAFAGAFDIGQRDGGQVLLADALVRVAEGHAVGLVGAVLLHEHAEARNAFAGAFDIGQRDGGQVLLADAAGHLGLVVGVAGLSDGRLVGDERVGAEHAGVGRDGLGGRHGHVRRVDAGLGPHAVGRVGVGRAGVAQRVVGQIDGQVAGHAGVDARLVLRHDHDHLLRIEREVLAVLVAGDDGGAVVGGATAHEKRCASHGVSLVGE